MGVDWVSLTAAGSDATRSQRQERALVHTRRSRTVTITGFAA